MYLTGVKSLLPPSRIRKVMKCDAEVRFLILFLTLRLSLLLVDLFLPVLGVGIGQVGLQGPMVQPTSGLGQTGFFSK